MSLLCTRGRLEPGDPHITSPAPLQKPLARPPGPGPSERQAEPGVQCGSDSARPGVGPSNPATCLLRPRFSRATASLWNGFPLQAPRSAENRGRGQASGRAGTGSPVARRPAPASLHAAATSDSLPAPAHLELPHQPQELQQVPSPAARHGRSG